MLDGLAIEASHLLDGSVIEVPLLDGSVIEVPTAIWLSH